MWRYGVNFQFISILVLLTEPLAKGLLSYYGNLTAVGYFEMANRLVTQVRAVLVSANQVLVPYYAKMGETTPETIKTLYMKNLNAVFVLGSLTFSSLVAMSPLISELWIGRLEPQFLLFAVMLAGGWFINVLSVPAYFANLGIGRIADNVLQHGIMSALVIVFGVVGGRIAGVNGSAAALPLALFVGGAILILTFHRAEAIPLRALFTNTNSTVLLLGISIAFFGFTPYLFLSEAAGLPAALTALAALLASLGSLIVFVPQIRKSLRPS